MSVLGEAALSAFFGALFNKFSSFDFKLVSEKKVHKKIEKWEVTLKNINAVLADAEERQMKDQQVKIWLADLQDLAYDVDDILDEFATDSWGRKLMNNSECQARSSKVQNCIPTFCTSLQPNAIMFNNKMMSKIKHISKRLKQIETGKISLQLTGFREPKKINIPNRLPSTSLVNEAEVYGRGNDKEAIVNLLLRDDNIDGGVSVIPIVGMGGIGKTTLAQLVYNDCSVRDHFDIQAWVCVSEEFDIIKITKTILQSITHEPCEHLHDFNLLQVSLKGNLSRKKFLVVLDDIWNESYDDWTKLRYPFDAGAPGSKILITTRSSNVSSIVKTVSDFPLQKLSDDDSLSMFVHHALGTPDFSDHLDLKEIGLEIVRKCDGLPLATKTIGGLLRGRIDHDAWKDILESEIWNLPEEKSGIIPALWLSYYHLSSQLKQCFAYCSILPKDYEFMEQEIILLWMAEGFLNEANTKQIEDLGRKYFKELVSRSFFQVSKRKKSHFVMHDLINDLAQSVAGEICFRMDGHEQMKFPRYVRHSSYIIGHSDGIKRFETFYSTKSLRTFLPFTLMLEQTCYISNNVVNDLLPKFRCLRVLSLQRYHITKIPSSLGNLRHLRYLDFSFTAIRSLPDSLCALYNLETLLLRFCEYLEKLPSEIGILVSLYHLDITGAYLIKEMPNGVGKLTNLRALSNFIVGQSDGLNIREIRNLSKLKGQLSISELQNVDEAHCAWEAKLSSLFGLDNLELKWSTDFNKNLRKKEVEREVLNLLQPHEELKALAIKYYAGIAFPIWIEDPSFKNLQFLKFEDCRNCGLLPAVGRLPLLKELYFKGMRSVISVGNEFYGENWRNAFPSLETLHFEDMPEWKEWKRREVDEKGKKFCCLRKLFIENCPKLAGTLPGWLPCLEKLVINECQELVVPVSNLLMLGELEIDGCKELVLGSSIDLWSVKKIFLSNISKFTCVTKEMVMPESMKVEDLHISVCGELASFWQTKWGWMAPLRSLHSLKFEKCPKVVSIGAAKGEVKEEHFQLKMPSNIELIRIQDCEGLGELSKTLHDLSCLTELEVVKCPKLVSISLDTLPPTLKTLVIGNCENLQCLLDDRENINFSSTSVLESLRVSNCETLKSLSSSGKLPVRLKRLDIHGCPVLEFLAHDIGDNNGLESIFLRYCRSVKYLPEGMDKLGHLQMIDIQKCGNLVCFPETGLPATTNLKSVWLIGCEKLQALPNVFSLRDLYIADCPRVKSIVEGGFPTNLTTLAIDEPKISKAAMGWGLHRLTFLTQLEIDGSCIDAESFPQEEIGTDMKLPPSLILLFIYNFKNLRRLSSNGFRNLTSLQSLWIFNCPKLKSLPEKEMLPSLVKLLIWNCLLLKESCKRGRGKQWSNIVHIPCVEIDGRFIHE
ncbi:hypothetical protein REPUB_Repub13aG0131800 [Reevesia pubescens]